MKILIGLFLISFGCLIAEDLDLDGLDAVTEASLGTSDLFVDSDGDGIGDSADLFPTDNAPTLPCITLPDERATGVWINPVVESAPHQSVYTPIERLQLQLQFENNLENAALNELGIDSSNNITYAAGIVGNAAILNGNDSVVTIDNSDLINGVGTVELWFNVDELAAKQTLLSRGESSSKQWMLQLEWGEVGLNLSDDGSGYETFQSGVGVTAGSWNHIAFTYNSGNYIVYLNGTAILTGVYANGINPQQSPILVGIEKWTGNHGQHSFKGKIDELRFHTTVLNQTEITESMQRGQNGCHSIIALPALEALSADWELYDNTDASGATIWQSICTDNLNSISISVMNGVFQSGTALNLNTTYYARCRFRNTENNCTDWSPLSEFTTAASLIDTDGDGLPDAYELANGLDPNDPSDASQDLDGDGLNAVQEFAAGTNLNNSDTDNDSHTDAWEAARGFDPLFNPDYQLAGWWKLDEESGTVFTDSSPAGTDAFASGNPLSSAGLINKAVIFDGTDDLLTVSSPMLPNTPFSIACFINITEPFGNTVSGTYTDGDMVLLKTDNLEICKTSIHSIKTTIGAAVFESQGGVIVPGRWYHLVVTATASQISIYLNGEQVASIQTAVAFAPSGSLTIGGTDNGTDKSFLLGTMDDIRIYRRILSDEQIRMTIQNPRFDSDEDGLSNLAEANLGTDAHKVDSDDDAMSDLWEVNNGFRPADASDADLDPDGDLLVNKDEFHNNTDPKNPDTDSDQLPDGYEVANNLNPLEADADLDPDSDTLTNMEEYIAGTNPHNADTDSDQLPDAYELANNLDPFNNSADKDPDHDSLTNFEEFTAGTNPHNSDTDSDQMDDAYELLFGFNPLQYDSDLDPDSDGYTNFDEYNNGTHPMLAPTVVDGYEFHKTGIVTSYYADRFTELPDFSEYLPYKVAVSPKLDYKRTRKKFMNSGRDDYLGILLEGCLLIPETGEYTLSLESDDGVRLFVDGIEQFDTNWQHPMQEESIILQLSEGVHKIRIEFFEYAGFAGLHFRWAGPGIEKSIIPESAFVYSEAMFNEVIETVDADSDGLSLDQEIAAGTDPNSNDSDSDGISDYDELLVHGTDALNNDSDGDSWTDGEEINLYFSDPLVQDIGTTITDKITINGSDFSDCTGIWNTEGTSAVSQTIRGDLTYNITLTEPLLARCNIFFTQAAEQSERNDFRLIVFVDNEYVGAIEKTVEFGTVSEGFLIAPYLAVGQHTLRIQWDNVYQFTSLKIKEIKFQEVTGIDADIDGTPDWQQNRLNNMCSVDKINGNTENGSYTSPACLEGNGRYTGKIAIPNAAVKRSVYNRWYADVPLASDGPTTIDVSFQDGAKIETVGVEWLALDLADPTCPENLTIRTGDSIRILCSPEAPAVITPTASSVQETEYTIITFNDSGTYTINANPQSQIQNPKSVTITVIGITQPDSPAIWLDRKRQWTWDGLPEIAVLEGEKIRIEENSVSADSRTLWLFRREIHEHAGIAARLGETGPILTAVQTEGFWLRSVVEGYVRTIQLYEDGASLIENTMFTYNLPESVRVNLKIFVGGIIFEDGSIEMDVDRSDFTDLETFTYNMIHPPESRTSVCHRTKAFQGSEFIGDRVE